MRVLVAGARTWKDAAAIRARLAALPADAVVLHPDPAQVPLGALVAGIAQDLGLAHEPTPAPDGALPERISQVLAFHAYLPKSRLTKAVVDEAARRGIPTEVIARRAE